MLTSSKCHLISSLDQVVGGELEPEEKEELAEKIGKLLQRDRMGVRTKLGKLRTRRNQIWSFRVLSTLTVESQFISHTCKL